MVEHPTGRIDPDVDLHDPGDRRELRVSPWPVLGVISAGGVVGALARAALQDAFPHHPTGFPWATFGVNVSGCLLIGVLMTLVNEVWSGRRLVRPFLGVGVLGGFTTFSTYVVDIRQAVAAGAPWTAAAYLAATMTGALVAVWLGAGLTAGLLRLGRRNAPAGG